MNILGLDVGGSGIKGAVVDPQSGTLVTERYRLDTPYPATPEMMIDTIAQIVAHFDWKGPVGCGFPAVVKDGLVQTASNISPYWVGVSVKERLEQATGCPVWVLNDADAAGLAEVRFGAGLNQPGIVLVVTMGTGIGTALFIDGNLVPNTELGHIELDGKDAEKYASDGVRKKKDLKWKHWAKRVDTYLHSMEQLLWPDLFIIGGGVSKKSHKFLPRLTLRTRVVPASLLNDAGIVGAALATYQSMGVQAADNGHGRPAFTEQV
jgi:polyphosphate glucokinase